MMREDWKAGELGHVRLHNDLARHYNVGGWISINDDGNDIQNIINQVSIRGGGMVIMSPGTRVIPQKIILKNGVFLVAYGVTLQLAAGIDDNVIEARGQSNVGVFGVSIDGNAAEQRQTNPHHGIALYECGGVAVRDCQIANCELDGVYVGSQGDTPGCSNIRIQNNHIINNRRNGISVTAGSDVWISDNRLVGNNAGVAESEVYRAGTVDIEPNYSGNKCERITITNNILDCPYDRGLQITGHAPVRSVAVSHNIVSAHDIGLSSHTDGGENIHFFANKVTANSGGIVIGRNSTFVSIDSNAIHGPGEWGVLVTNGVSLARVSNNTIYAFGLGINLNSALSPVTRVHVHGNTVFDADTLLNIGNAQNVSHSHNELI